MSFKRIVSLLLSALLLLTPMLASAEEYSFPAGELTAVTLADSYAGGYQINTQLGFDVDTAALSGAGEKMKAAAVLLDKAVVQMSFYDDFGTARIRGSMTLDGAEIISGDMLVFEDGSVQLKTSLTGNMAFTLPAGTVTENGIVLPGSEIEWSGESLEELDVHDRLRVTGANMMSTLLNLLLGWVSGTQMETGELYTFDYETYLDATETRDAVATRMLGKIRSTDLIELVWNVVTHIRDKEHDFQAALAMSIGKLGLTRYNGRQIIDSLFPQEYVDPEVYFIQPSEEIRDDGALFMYDDLRYLLCKLDVNLMNAWGDNTLDTESSMVVSYDDFGGMVGLDIDFQRATKVYPFEGDFTYSVRTDDNWQRRHTAHGELQVTETRRVVGDLDMQLGQDVDGVNESRFGGQIDVVDPQTGDALGLGVKSALRFDLAPDGNGESIEADADLQVNVMGESLTLVDTDVSAVSSLTEMGLTLTGAVDIRAIELPQVTLNVSVDCVEYEETPFEGGQAVDLSAELSEEQLDAIKDAAKSAASSLAVKLALKPAVLGNLLTLAEGLVE